MLSNRILTILGRMIVLSMRQNLRYTEMAGLRNPKNDFHLERSTRKVLSPNHHALRTKR